IRIARSCAASTWSSVINARLRSRRAASSRRRAPFTCPIWPSQILRMASRPASASSLSAKATRVKKCALPSVPESKSMADTQQQGNEPKKQQKPQGAAKGAKDGGAPKGAKESDAPKGAKESDAPKVKKPRERSDYVARLKTQFEQTIRGELTR